MNYDVLNPATGKKLHSLKFNTNQELDAIITSAHEAYYEWSNTSLSQRSKIIFKFKNLLEKNIEKIAKIITCENGKTLPDAIGEVRRGIDVVDFACNIPHLLKGEFSENISTKVDIHSVKQSLGVCSGFTPYNFPVMIPLWMFPIAIACGNTFILKPSEKVPTASIELRNLMLEAGLPDNVLQVAHGSKDVVNQIIKNNKIKAVSFVGSTSVARSIYAECANQGKRVQALGGAKNHCLVMPDADLSLAIPGIIGAAYGSAGQRCMAISVVVAVGKDNADKIVSNLKNALGNLRIGNGLKKDIDMGPLISEEHKQSIINYIETGINQGADLIVDGSSHEINKEKGFFIGPTLFDNVKTNMEIYKNEIFGPVLCIIRVESLDEGIKLINQNLYANGASIYSNSGIYAREFTRQIDSGMVGVNIPIPVPMAIYSFGGNKESLFGATDVHGISGVSFYTRIKKVTTKWPHIQDDKALYFTL